jgi:integrase
MQSKRSRHKARYPRTIADGIQQRGPAQFRAYVMLNGERHHQTFATQDSAEAWRATLVEAHGKRHNRVHRAVEARKLTLAQAMSRRLLLKPANNEAGRDDQRRATERIVSSFPLLAHRPLFEIDEIDIDDFISARLDDGVTNSTVNRDLAAISVTFNLARAKMGCVGLRNPVGPGTRLPENKGRVRRLSQAEEEALMREATLDEAVNSVPIRTIIALAVETAMRQGEICAMRWEHTDIAGGIIHLPDTKNGTPRNVPLWPCVRALLRDIGTKESGPVWPRRETIRTAWLRVRRSAVRRAQGAGNVSLAASLAGLRFHDLRHEGTSRLIEKTGWSDAQIMAVTGHKTSAMLARYSHLRANKLAAAMVALEGGETGLKLVAAHHDADGEVLPETTRKRQIWKAISADKAVLAALVAAKPIRDIAADFGVSDVAVHKACVRLDIQKMRPGHWLKKSVEA